MYSVVQITCLKIDFFLFYNKSIIRDLSICETIMDYPIEGKNDDFLDYTQELKALPDIIKFLNDPNTPKLFQNLSADQLIKCEERNTRARRFALNLLNLTEMNTTLLNEESKRRRMDAEEKRNQIQVGEERSKEECEMFSKQMLEDAIKRKIQVKRGNRYYETPYHFDNDLPVGIFIAPVDFTSIHHVKHQHVVYTCKSSKNPLGGAFDIITHRDDLWRIIKDKVETHVKKNRNLVKVDTIDEDGIKYDITLVHYHQRNQHIVKYDSTTTVNGKQFKHKDSVQV